MSTSERTAEEIVESSRTAADLAKRIYIPLTATSPPGLVEADTLDPWSKSGKYALGWTYFCVVLLVLVAVTRIYHLWNDKIRQAIWKQETERQLEQFYREVDYSTMAEMQTGRTADELFPRNGRDREKEMPALQWQSTIASVGPINDTLALFRWIFYRPIPELHWRKRRLSFPSLAVVMIIAIAIAFIATYCFLQKPLYWQDIQYGSPPLAIRAGMIGVAMVPWIVALSMKSNIISWITGIGHDRLGVFHRYGGYLLLFMCLVHTIPFYVQPVWNDGYLGVYAKLFPPGSGIVYGSGIACLVPLIWLCVASLPIIRSAAYELFVILHIPAAIVFIAMLFWHTKNYLNSWGYLYATVAIWALAYCTRLFNTNWTNPRRLSWLVGDEAAITLMAENCIKVTVPTQMKWRPGQYVYLRMPGISFFENHPFTISSLCSEDFPSEYGEAYRDCTLVFRPFGGFTKKVLNTAIEKGPFKTYRAFLEGPYGGMQRELAAFDTVVLIAGGSGITSIVSQLLNLIKRMRDGKAVTKNIEVVWSLKRLEAMDWFKEELRICREFAPPETVTCQFYVTAAKRQQRGMGMSERAPRPLSMALHDKLDGFVAGIASKRNSAMIRDEAQGDAERERELREENEDAITSLPQQKYLQPRMPPTPEYKDPSLAHQASLRKLEGGHYAEKPRDDHSDTRKFFAPHEAIVQPFHYPPISSGRNTPHFNYAPGSPRNANRLSQSYDPNSVSSPPVGPPSSFGGTTAYSPSTQSESQLTTHFPPPPTAPSLGKNGRLSKKEQKAQQKEEEAQALPYPKAPAQAHTRDPKANLHISIPNASTSMPPASNFDFGFPSTPTLFQKNLMRFAFMPKPKKAGWSTEYGRPDLSYMLKEMSRTRYDGKPGGFGRRTCVFVCGPPSMRVDVANTVAELQAEIWGDEGKDELFLHTENYAI